MYKGKMVIDVHGHISTPPHFRAHAYNLIALRTPGDDLAIPEAAMKAALDRHVKMLDERNIDVQLISPRPVAMMHWERPFIVEDWTRVTNNVIAEQCRLHPTRFAGVGQLPQTRFSGCAKCVGELKRCVEELGFVGAIVNPDPGGDRQSPGMDDEYWFPIYEAAEALNATLVVHPSLTKDPRVERIPHAYQYNNLTEETFATILLEHSDVFTRFPKLRIVICHCGGALRRMLEKNQPIDAVKAGRGASNIVGSSGQQAGGQVGMTLDTKEIVKPNLSRNLFFDTCSYDPHLLGGAIKQRRVDRMVFGTEVPGAGSALRNSDTGKPSDDILAILKGFDFLNDEERIEIVHENPKRIFPLLEGRF
jgi:predicted TIM-barrel fold metal-dependent hydrolase